MANATGRAPRDAGRPRGFETRQVVDLAGDLFWERGYAQTSVGELEKKTGLDRSSLYNAFGNKHAIFEAALDCYVEANLERRLAGMRSEAADLAAVARFFTAMSEAFRTDPRASRGCLIVNSVTEVGASDTEVLRRAERYRDNLRAAFAAALGRAAARGEVEVQRVRPRAEFLTAATLGLFVTARIDLDAAAETCDGVAAEVLSWQR
jgi:AcrR family transcriptional regulator